MSLFSFKRKKYEKAFIRKYSDELVKAILDGKVNYVAYPYKEDCELKNYKRGESRALVMNSSEKYVFALEFGKSELKEYKEVKKNYKLDLKDSDKYSHISLEFDNQIICKKIQAKVEEKPEVQDMNQVTE